MRSCINYPKATRLVGDWIRMESKAGWHKIPCFWLPLWYCADDPIVRKLIRETSLLVAIPLSTEMNGPYWSCVSTWSSCPGFPWWWVVTRKSRTWPLPSPSSFCSECFIRRRLRFSDISDTGGETDLAQLVGVRHSPSVKGIQAPGDSLSQGSPQEFTPGTAFALG